MNFELTWLLDIRRTSPPLRVCNWSVCGRGRPSFIQVILGSGIPEAMQVSSSGLLTITDISRGSSDPLIWGGSILRKLKPTIKHAVW